MLKPLGWAAFATLAQFLLGIAFVSIVKIQAYHAVEVGSELSKAFLVCIGLANFLQRFWWFFLPFIFAGWAILCYIVYGIRRSSTSQTVSASAAPR